MKKFSHFLVIGLCAIAAFTSCKKEDNGPAPLPVEQIVGEYGTTPQKTFALNYSGKPMAGKIVTVEANDNKTAKLTIKGANPMAQKAGMPGLTFPGVIAGETETVLNVNLVNEDGIAYSFEGEDKNDKRTIKYNGKLNAETIALNLEVTVNNTLAGSTYNLKPYTVEGENEYNQKITSTPIYVKWRSEGELILGNLEFVPGKPTPFPMPAITLINLGLNMKKEIPADPADPNAKPGKEPCVHEMLQSVFKSVSFLADGNIVAEFKSKPTDAEWTKSEINVAQYYVEGEKVYVVLNIAGIMQAVMAPQSKAEGEFNIEPILPGLMKLLPMLSNGIPLTLKETVLDDVNGKETEEKGTVLCFDTAMMKDLLNNIVIPLLADPGNQAILGETIKAAAGDMANLIQIDVLVKSLAEDVKVATEIELGLNVTKAN